MQIDSSTKLFGDLTYFRNNTFWYTENGTNDDDDDELDNFLENEHFSNNQHCSTRCFKKQKECFFLTENLDGFNKAFTEWKTHRCTVKITVVFIKASCNGRSITFEFLVFLEILKCFCLLHNQFERKLLSFCLGGTRLQSEIKGFSTFSFSIDFLIIYSSFNSFP